MKSRAAKPYCTAALHPLAAPPHHFAAVLDCSANIAPWQASQEKGRGGIHATHFDRGRRGEFLLFSLTPSGAQAQADYYKGKTVSVVIGAKTGSLALAAQIVSQHLGRYIPGNPTVIFRQMPGGAHLGATGYIYNVAEPDGLNILAANPGVGMAELAGLPQVRFDIRKFEWLGSSGSDGSLFSIRADLPYKTFKEFKDLGRELIAGTTGPGSNAYDMPLLLKEFAGANLKLLKGYAANSDILLAIERKEVDAYAALGTTIKLAVDRGAVRALVRARAPVPVSTICRSTRT